MSQRTNPIGRTEDDIERLGKYLRIILLFCPTLAGQLVNPNGRDIWGLLALTAPFTAAVALVTYLDIRGEIHGIGGFLLSASLLLIALSLVSKWMGLGTAIDVGKFLQQHQEASGNPLTLLWGLLRAYFELYKPVTFCASLGCGIYLGYSSAKAASAKENAAKS